MKKNFVHFWATWCAPCEKELPDLLKFALNENKTITFLFISVNDEAIRYRKVYQKV